MSSIAPPHSRKNSTPTGAGQGSAQRYIFQERLASGGMGVVYRVLDRVSGTTRALKRLSSEGSARNIVAEAFEREYHVLAGLDHPRIIRVFDYGIDEHGPYYTMELIEGGDLHDAAPLPYREACLYLRDVAASLALLHARRLLHRDVSPRNVRMTGDGHCKLIDFGALATFGQSNIVVGTLPAIPPEALHGAPLDQRADLYALGALAYWILTGRQAYPARAFDQLVAVWARPVPAPSTYHPDIPKELDALVLSLLQTNPLARPASAAEIIARLNVIGELPPETANDSEWLAKSFLLSPRFTGRARELESLDRHLDAAIVSKGGAISIRAMTGMGRTRLLEEVAVRAQLAGASVVRVDATMYRQLHGTTRAIVLQLFERLPDVARDCGARFTGALSALGQDIAARVGARSRPPNVLARGPMDATPASDRLENWFAAVSGNMPLVLQIDNVDEADHGSLGLLAALAEQSKQQRLLILMTERTGQSQNPGLALKTLRSHASALELPGLSESEMLELVRSLFGDAPNLERFADWLQERTVGSPLHALELCRQLIAKQLIRHAGGAWTLPVERPDTKLPSALEEALRTRLATLGSEARALAECLSLQQQQPTFALCQALAHGLDDRQLLALLDELSRNDVLCAETDGYRFTSSAIREALLGGMDDGRQEDSHRRLGDALYALAGEHNPALRIQAGFHLIKGGQRSRGAEIIANVASDSTAIRTLMANHHRIGVPLEAALHVYRRLRKSAYECMPLLSALAQAGYYEERIWGERYGDEALNVLEDMTGVGSARRLRGGIGRLFALIVGLLWGLARFCLRPKAVRSYSFVQVLQHLMSTVTSLAGTASLSLDAERATRLADVLEPFAVLPERTTLVGIYRFCRGLQEIGRENEVSAYATFDRLIEHFNDPKYYPTLPTEARTLYTAGAHFARATFGIFRADGRGVLESANALDATGLRLYTMIGSQLRFLYRIYRGEFLQAEQHRSEVELHAAQVGSIWQVETWEAPALMPIYALLNDVVALTRTAHQLELMSKAVPAVRPHSRIATETLMRMRGDAPYVQAVHERYLRMTPKSYIGWAGTLAQLAHSYNELGRHAEAREVCDHALLHIADADRDFAMLFLHIDVEAAMADAGLGQIDRAFGAIDALLQRFEHCQHPLVHGLLHEARARIAWNAGLFEDHERSCAAMESWYRPTRTPILIARCEEITQLRTRSLITKHDLHPAKPEEIETVVATVHSAHSGSRSSLDKPAMAALAGPGRGRIADRYQLQQLLGRGGMASAHRALDVTTGATLALKLLALPADQTKIARSVELFEREFHTLAQLAHPRVVRAHDYGVDKGQPYYTMELLDGGDLNQLAPLPWREVCTAAYELCSALALLHSRHLVHRDVTPRNVRRTADGKAKLIDFGLLAPMGPTTVVAGTPPFVAPEVVNNQSLDGRSDLFSLGATLYFALTGRLAFSAQHFSELPGVWQSSPLAPSKLVPGIPKPVDDIVLALLRIDAGSRPKTAAEVMDRLLPLLDVAPDEELRVATAYLTTPRLVGREDIVKRFRKQMLRTMWRRGGGFVIAGEAGTGRSRLIDAFILEAKLVGATAIRASAANATRPFGVAAALAQQVHAAAPALSLAAARKDPQSFALLFEPTTDAPTASFGTETETETEAAFDLVDITASTLDRAQLSAALRSWWIELARERPLAIAVDDLDRIDEPSAALLASLSWEAPALRLVYAVSLDSAARTAPSTAIAVLREHASLVALTPLQADQITGLLRSVFGDVPNLQRLSYRLHALCGGKPRECMTFAQFLVDQGVITYAGGSWTLPAEIAADLLPASIEQALEHQVRRLTSFARQLASALALSLVERLSRAQLLEFGAMNARALDTALDELLAARFIAGDDAGYALSHESLAAVLLSLLSSAEAAQIHDTLVGLHEQPTATVHPLVIGYHKLLGSQAGIGLDYLLERSRDADARIALMLTGPAQLGGERTARTLELALREAERRERATRDKQTLWVMLAGLSGQGEDARYYYSVPSAWLDGLKRDSGWTDWQQLDPNLDPVGRALHAITAAGERYNATPEAERLLAPGDAIKQMVAYVVFSLAVSVRTLDLELMAKLPTLLEPFAPLNPIVAAMCTNAQATRLNGAGKHEAAREAFLTLVQQLDGLGDSVPGYMEKVRASLSQTLAQLDAMLSVPSMWIDRLAHDDHDANQRIGARYLQKVVALQHGAWETAEKHRQQAELLALQNNAGSMFSTLGQELEVHAAARDLTGLKQVRSRLTLMAAQSAGWQQVLRVADAHYLHLCGDLVGALEATSAARADDATLESAWTIAAATLEVEVLAELGRAEIGLALGHGLLAHCETSGMRHLARKLAHAVAFAEAKLGQTERALSRMTAVIDEQVALNVSGLPLGRSYELAARIALWSNAAAAFEKFATLAAEQYRPGESSVLGALYERLMEEADAAGLQANAPRQRGTYGQRDRLTASQSRITGVLSACDDKAERTRRALELLCEGEPSTRGHLFLFSEQGLELSASNVACDALPELRAFAQSCVDVELEQDSSLLSQALTQADSELGQWRDANGHAYKPLLLGVRSNDRFCIAGVAILAEAAADQQRAWLELAPALAKSLLDTGDARGVSAA